MRIPRIYQAQTLQTNTSITLDEHAAKHVARVLRLRPGASLILFNGDVGEYLAEIVAIEKLKVHIQINSFTPKDVESPLQLHLGQVISRGEKMDYTIQKAVELGVTEITPLFSERCNVKLSGDRLEKRLKHWQGTIISACEQSGRIKIPTLHPAQDINSWIKQEQQGLALVLHHRNSNKLSDLETKLKSIRLLIGPEGGLSEDEISLAEDNNFQSLSLGPRILRTETAALTAITALQCRWGDLA